MFIQYLNPMVIHQLTGGDIRSYIARLVRSFDNDDIVTTIMNGCKATYIKYGKEWLRQAIDVAVNTGQYVHFTNDGRGLRDNLVNKVTQKNFLDYMVSLLNGQVMVDASIGTQVIDTLIDSFDLTHGRQR